MQGIAVRTVRSFVVGAVAWASAATTAEGWPSPHTLPGFDYVSPAPGSSLHFPSTNIIVRPGGRVDPSSVAEGAIQATGTQSGAHTGHLKLSDDGRTILFFADSPYTADENVTCVIAPGIRTDTGGDLPGAEFTFRIAPLPTAAAIAPSTASLLEELELERLRAPAPFVPAWTPASGLRAAGARADTLPADFPAIQDTVWEATGSGAYFVSDIVFTQDPYSSYLMILREDGTPVWYRRTPDRAYDFKVQPNRWLTYFDATRSAYYALNAKYALVDSFRCGNGHLTDVHEVRILPDGHALLMAYDNQEIDMSAVVPGGRPDATVTGLIIQELDREKDVVFQWRSWDHFQFTDVTSRSLTAGYIDYVHGNAIERDPDGSLLISSRHMDEITKISRETGEILWRLGGKNNEFTFVNDPGRFYQQHAIRRLSNGHITLFDNGNNHTPPYSRAAEYELDEVAKTATLVWEFRNTPETYGFAMGYVQRLPNGNTVIGWGATNPTLTEVSPAGEKLAELSLPASIFSYRAYKFEWPPVLSADVTPDPTRVSTSSEDPWLRATIQSDEFQGDSLDVATVRLGGIASEGIEAGPADLDGDGRREITLRFPRDELMPYLSPGAPPLELRGTLTSGELVHGLASIRAVNARPSEMRVVSRVGASTVELVLGSPALIAEPITLSVFDARGRLVRRFDTRSDGEGFLRWDGRGRDGGRLPSGIYHLRVEGAVEEVTGRVVLVR